MASREKKAALTKKQAPTSPVPSRESTLITEVKTESFSDIIPRTSIIKPNRYIRKTEQKALRKTVRFKLASKTKLKQNLAKKVLNNVKNGANIKKTLLKNGIKPKVGRKPKVRDIKDKNAISCSVGEKSKKKIKKKFSDEASIINTIETIVSQFTAVEDKPQKKSKVQKKIKVEASQSISKDNIEDVMNDLDALIKGDGIKIEPEDSGVERQEKMNEIQVKKDLQKSEVAKRILKKSSDADAQYKLIDMLDLDVTKPRRLITKRRYSIDECSVHYNYVPNNQNIFSSIPRSISPKLKRTSKMRQSLDVSAKRLSPYITRSDAPARILRNGKHRKLRDGTLLEGLDTEFRKRRRLCFDYSGSEKSISKSGYESDSSFSDLASQHSTENSEAIDINAEIRKEPNNMDQENLYQKSPSVESNLTLSKYNAGDDKCLNSDVKCLGVNFDSNSNLCDNNVQDEMNLLNVETLSNDNNVYSSSKVPEKSIILDSMKQIFNDMNSDNTVDKLTCKSHRTNLRIFKTDVISFSTPSYCGNQNSSSLQFLKGSEEEPSTIEESDVDVENISETTTLQFLKNVEEEPTMMEEINPVNSNDPSLLVFLKGAEEEPSKIEIINVDTKTTNETVEFDNTTESIIKNDDITRCSLLEQQAGDTFENEEDEGFEKRCNKIILNPETPENLAVKESIFQALGLQSLRAAEAAAKLKSKQINYTGTLKTVIKLSRNEKKKGKASLKMTTHKYKKGAKEIDGYATKIAEDLIKGGKEVIFILFYFIAKFLLY